MSKKKGGKKVFPAVGSKPGTYGKGPKFPPKK